MNLDEALSNMRRSFEAGRLAHAYVAAGSVHGDGREFTEKALQLLFCSSESGACGTCKSCRDVLGHKHPDVLWIEPQKKSRVISIEQIRVLQQRIFQTAFEGEWKSGVLVGADRLGVGASNAFLKTLEEPAGRSIFFLLTDSLQSLLPTVLSRCQVVRLSGTQDGLPDVWRKGLLEILTDGAGAADLEDGTESRAGSVADGYARSDRLGRLLKEVKKAAEAKEMEIAEASGLIEDEDTLKARIDSCYREVRTGLMRVLMHWYRDMLLLVCGGQKDLLFHQVYLDVLRRKARGMTCRTALRNVEITENMNRQLEENVSEEAVFCFGFSRLP